MRKPVTLAALAALAVTGLAAAGTGPAAAAAPVGGTSASPIPPAYSGTGVRSQAHHPRQWRQSAAAGLHRRKQPGLDAASLAFVSRSASAELG